MVEMSDPTILAFDRPLYEEEVAEFDQINLDEFRMNFGVFITTSADRD